jgi:hypothetical protein
MITKTASLYSNQNGMMCCIEHGGSYLRSEYAHAPEQRHYSTPLDVWERVDVLYAREWTQLRGTPPKCEMCR